MGELLRIGVKVMVMDDVLFLVSLKMRKGDVVFVMLIFFV